MKLAFTAEQQCKATVMNQSYKTLELWQQLTHSGNTNGNPIFFLEDTKFS